MGIMPYNASAARRYPRSRCVETGGKYPVTKITTLQLLDPLKVFVEYDTQYEIYVAQCLQTGHLVTADSPEMAKEMIKELLEDEVSLAVKRNDISVLLSNPAKMELWFRWELVAKTAPTKIERDTIKVTHGEVPQELRLLLGQAEVETEIKIATGRLAAAA
jgi:hypothetical protein